MRVMRASCAKRKTTDAPGALGWRSIVFATASFLILAAPADAQEATNVGALSGTLKKVKDTGTITLGYRESSLPFSYLNRRQQPIGYSIDLCREIVEDLSTELDGMEIKIAFAPVSAVPTAPSNVRFLGYSGREMLAVRLSHFDRCCRKRILSGVSEQY
jgi:ABC-type amino acid transport substrate-binding protein